MRRMTGLAAAAMAAAAALAGCGGSASAPGSGATPSTVSASPAAGSTPAAPAAATPTTTPTPACATLTGAAAAKKWVHHVPTFERHTDAGYQWDVAQADTSTYDRCAPLSWITLPIHGPTASSPYQIMLFHQGEYIGTTLAEPRAYHPETKRISPSQIAVTYTYDKPGESTAGASGRARSTFTWDAARRTVVRAGQLPPTEGEEATSPTDAAPATGIPAGATRITAVRPKRESYERETAVIITPSGKIGCDLTARAGGCGVQSYIAERKYPEDDVGYPWWFSLDDASPRPVSKGDAPFYLHTDVPAQVVPYGQTVYYGRYVCTSARTGLTCRNADTGHGAEMSTGGYRSF